MDALTLSHDPTAGKGNPERDVALILGLLSGPVEIMRKIGMYEEDLSGGDRAALEEMFHALVWNAVWSPMAQVRDHAF
jgi:hypothetical protein